MNCALESYLEKEHENMREPRLGTIIVNCPIFGRQICYWCCLHVQDMSNPLTRPNAEVFNPRYKEVINKIRPDITLDGCWETCSSCRK